MRRTERNRALYFPSKAAGIILVVIAVAFFVYLFFHFWMLPVKTQNASMAPTLCEGDTLLADRWFKAGRTLKRGDLVLIENDRGERFIRRVIGMPGEMIELVAGEVFINGCPLDESSYRVPQEAEQGASMPILTLANDAYFLLSDDRGYTMDSRSALIGPKTLDEMLALVRFRVLPGDRLAFFK